jgi:hypothetical protein
MKLVNYTWQLKKLTQDINHRQLDAEKKTEL